MDQIRCLSGQLPFRVERRVLASAGEARQDAPMERVTGIGGVFFKASDPQRIKAWYVEHLGVPVDKDGYVTFEWREHDGGQGQTVWNPFSRDTQYYRPSEASFMVNYRVRDLDAMIAQLNERGIPLVGDRETSEAGRFAWILDPDGNKIELWEPPPAKPAQALRVAKPAPTTRTAKRANGAKRAKKAEKAKSRKSAQQRKRAPKR
jgi:catechol 2,3-dioxygenase-like lactoylglutathione lyase family enzyme